jgi:hypothetical protein
MISTTVLLDGSGSAQGKIELLGHGGELRGLEALQTEHGQLLGGENRSERASAVTQQRGESLLHAQGFGFGAQAQQNRSGGQAHVMPGVEFARPLGGLLQLRRAQPLAGAFDLDIGHPAMGQRFDDVFRQRRPPGEKKAARRVFEVRRQNFTGQDLLDAFVHVLRSAQKMRTGFVRITFMRGVEQKNATARRW